ncbi:MAG: CRISPR-associated endonuclease Cas2 [Oxalobacteraceae bacterium]|nr:CRISPR-associated endonuclease Cas2 [Oxalobacteraceae bacterium]
MSRSLYVIAYDIHNNKTRRQVATLLATWRVGGQHSLAECWLSQTELSALWQRMTKLLDQKTDRLLVLRQDQRSHDRVLGQGRIYAGQPFIVG